MRRYCLILLSAFVVLSTSIFAQSKLSKKEVKDVVEKYFIKQDIPTRYYSNILIRIDGKITKADSVFLNNLIDNLNAHIDKWDVVLISEGTSNLILSVNMPQSESYPLERLGNRKQIEIIKKREPINLPEEATQQERNKILYYNLMKSLVKFYNHKEVRAIIPETVFVLNKPEEVTINNPIDFQIIDEIYSVEYDNKLDNPSKRLDNAAKNRQILIIATLLSNIVVTLLLLWMFLLGIFKKHNYIFTAYFKQGIIVLFTFIVGIVISVFIPIVFTTSDSDVKLIQGLAPVIAFTFGCLVLGMFILLFLYLSERLILRKNMSLFLNVVFPFLTTTVVPASLFYILVEFFSTRTNSKLPTIDQQNLMLTILSTTMSIAFYRAFLIFISRKSESIINQKDVELARMSEMHRKAELQSLRAKINPHFLYNSLNSIASLASIDSKKTEEMALSLSDFFKYSINREQKQTNPLSDELTAVETYLEIERVRFGDRLSYSVECPESLKSLQIPQLLIQPLVENAVKHGVSKLLKDGVVRIVISELESMKISIRVYDNGPDFPDGPMSGFGIRNTHDRLQLIYDDKASLNWKNKPEKYFELILPKHPVTRYFESSQHSTETSNPTQQTDTSSVRKIMNILWGISAFLVLAGATFKVQHYPNGSEILAIGFISGLIMAILEIIRLIITLKEKE